jgi:hypothetical protein
MRMRILRGWGPVFFLMVATLTRALAQGVPVPQAPDTLVFTNGDQLTGHLVSAAGGSVVFASDMAGNVTIPFAKVKELRAGSKASEFALLKKGVVVKRGTPAPEGTVSIADGKVAVSPAGKASNADGAAVAESVPAAEVSLLVPRAEFDKEVSGHEPFFSAWNGAITGGATLVRSSTNATTLTAGINLVRATPTVAWLPPRDRTTLNVVETYGKNTVVVPPPQETTLSSIFHADSERDEYFTGKLYALGDIAFDHNYAQGLALQQIYGGGLGWTPVKDAKQELDFKMDLHYERQTYITTPVNGAVVTPTIASPNLIGSTIFQSYHRNLPRKLVFTESVNAIPAFNIAADYSANATAALAIPVIKRLSATISSTDSFLNDPAPGYRKNSFQFVTGVTYTLK